MDRRNKPEAERNSARVLLLVTERTHQRMAEMSRQKGLSLAELGRQAVMKYLGPDRESPARG